MHAGTKSLAEVNMRERYCSLVGEVFGLLDLGSVPQPADDPGPLHAVVAIDDVDFLLVHGDPQSLVLSLYCKFGELADASEAKLRRLLQINLALAPDNKGVFGADDEGCLIFHVKTPLRAITAPELLNAMRDAAAQALAWRDGRFVNTDLPAPPIALQTVSSAF
jgi:hypothetical protein